MNHTKGALLFAMSAMNNISEAFLELTVIPFLFVMSLFLSGRMATKSEVNRRFLYLVISTLLAACYEAALELFTDMNDVRVWKKVFYSLININAYCLMCYVAAYTRTISRRFTDIHYFILAMKLLHGLKAGMSCASMTIVVFFEMLRAVFWARRFTVKVPKPRR